VSIDGETNQQKTMDQTSTSSYIQEDEILLEVIRNQTDIKWANVAQQFNIRAL